MHFPHVSYLIQILPKVVYHPNKSAWVQVLDWCRVGDMTFPEPNITRLTDKSLHQHAYN